MIIKVRNPKQVYIEQFKSYSDQNNDLDGTWYVSCLNPHYVAPKTRPSFPDDDQCCLQQQASRMWHLEDQKRIYFHADGQWRTVCINENGEFTAYFKSKTKLLQQLKENNIPKPLQFDDFIAQLNHEMGFTKEWMEEREKRLRKERYGEL